MSGGKLSLVYFEVDETYSIVETRKLQTTIPGALKEQGSKVKVKSGREVFEAEVVELNSKYTLRNVTDGDKNFRDYAQANKYNFKCQGSVGIILGLSPCKRECMELIAHAILYILIISCCLYHR